MGDTQRENRGRRARTGAVAGLGAVLFALVGCAPEPIRGWEPIAFVAVPGVVLESPSAGTPAEVHGRDESATLGEDPAPQDPSDTGDAASSQVAATPDQRELGLYTGRLRNDAIGLAARFVYIPGASAFNARIDQELWAAIESTAAPYAPQSYASEYGRTGRGCVQGSASWSAGEVLSRVETGPAGGVGVAVTCELGGAYGNLLEVRLRVVAGTADSDGAEGAATENILSDRLTVLFVDVSTGQLVEVRDAWNPSAAPELWRSIVELLRREAGSLSTAVIGEPDAPQLALASAALHAASDTAEGGLVVTFPPGISAPELSGLGIEATTEPLTLRIDAATVNAWSNEQYRELHTELGKPFVGITAKVSSVPIDCALIPCVAVTYDDGPSGLTAELLDTLADEQGRATFFMLSRRASANPDIVRRVIAEGNEVATHTINHPDLTTLPLPEATAQVLDSAATLSEITGRPITMFRPPYGAINDEIIAAVGLPSILWSIDTNDWQLPGKTTLLERSSAVARPGDIILFHDIHKDSVEAAGDVVRALHERGLELVTVTQLFGGQVPGGRVSSR